MGNAYDPSKFKGTEAIPVIPDGYLKKPLYFLDDSGNKVQVEFQPAPARVENTSPTSNDGVSSTNDGPGDDNLHNKETEAIWSDCVICGAVRLTENMLRSVKCGHNFCKVCIKNHVNSVVKNEAKQVIPADVRCPDTKYCTESLPANIVVDHLDLDVKHVWLAVHAFWAEQDRVAAQHGESSVQIS
ncbi:OLC1v1035691C1 [Oldenlandia corymbosa var. corymbosa]|uniref:OLC1v1035691C1 n=1 Tax=Oldenlandia corymbosa var. corymbosa TaxID=529605 RepID=A0AAV1CWY9_OLDCO|nr:OLC1v1035691C1 [Oldenlandia corymbosa var. corymbosa]